VNAHTKSLCTHGLAVHGLQDYFPEMKQASLDFAKRLAADAK